MKIIEIGKDKEPLLPEQLSNTIGFGLSEEMLEKYPVALNYTRSAGEPFLCEQMVDVDIFLNENIILVCEEMTADKALAMALLGCKYQSFHWELLNSKKEIPEDTYEEFWKACMTLPNYSPIKLEEFIKELRWLESSSEMGKEAIGELSNSILLKMYDHSGIVDITFVGISKPVEILSPDAYGRLYSEYERCLEEVEYVPAKPTHAQLLEAFTIKEKSQ